jgi:hypothetical protein
MAQTSAADLAKYLHHRLGIGSQRIQSLLLDDLKQILSGRALIPDHH